MNERQTSEWFEVVLDAASYQSSMECEFFERWPFFHKFSCDPYDGSIEIMFSPQCPAEWCPSEEDMQFLAGFGVTYGWFNFTDETEIHFGQSKPHARCSKAPNHRWSYRHWLSEESGREVTDEDVAAHKQAHGHA